MRHSLLKFGHMHLCGKIYKYFSPHCCKCNSCGCIAAIRCVNACRGPHCDSVYSGSEHRQFNSPRLVKREAGFPNLRRALIGSNQLWRVNDSPYYREYIKSPHKGAGTLCLDVFFVVSPNKLWTNSRIVVALAYFNNHQQNWSRYICWPHHQTRPKPLRKRKATQFSDVYKSLDNNEWNDKGRLPSLKLTS